MSSPDLVPQRSFDELVVGEHFPLPSRTVETVTVGSVPVSVPPSAVS